MNIQLLAYVLLWFVTGVSLAIWGLEDKKEYQVSVLSIIILSIVFWIFYAGFAITSTSFAFEFLIIGLFLTGITYLGLMKQIAGFDKYVLLISNITFPFISVPCLLLTLGLTINNKKANHAFVNTYARAFILISIAEAIGLLILLK